MPCIPSMQFFKNAIRHWMASGVPMVVIPFVSDQPVNAEQAAQLGLGKVLECKIITAENLKVAAFSVMEDAHIRNNLRKIQAEITHAPGNTGVVRIIESYYEAKEHRL